MIRFYGPKAPNVSKNAAQQTSEVSAQQARVQPQLAAAADAAAEEEARRKQRSLFAQTPTSRISAPGAGLGASPLGPRTLLGN